MSDLGDQSQQVDPQGGNEPQPPELGQVQPSPEDQLVNDFLKNVNPTHRAVVEPYYKDWGKKVGQRFNEIHEQYRPWKQIQEAGITPDQVGQLQQLAGLIQNDPVGFVRLLQASLPPEHQQQLQQQFVPQPQPGNQDDPWDGVDPRVVEAIQNQSKLEQMVAQMAELLVGTHQANQASSEQQELDRTLASLHAKHGEFDDDFVMTQMLKLDPMKPEDWDKAVSAWTNKIQAAIDKRSNGGKVQPKNLSTGPAPVGNDVPRPSQMKATDRQSLVAQMLGDSG